MRGKNEATETTLIDVISTIKMMESTNLCFHPVHYHSFSQVNFLIAGSMRFCACCQMRLKSVFGYNSDSNSQILKCMACGVYAHRECAMTSDISKWKERCKVNITKIELPIKEKEDVNGNIDGMENINPKNESTKKQNTISDIKEEVTMVWTNDGPPGHWTQKGEISKILQKDEEGRDISEIDEDEEPIDIQLSTFGNVARALQENIFMHFRGQLTSKIEPEQVEKRKENYDLKNQAGEPISIEKTKEISSLSQDMRDALFEECKPELPPTQVEKLVKFANETVKVTNKVSKIPQNVRVASVVGSIAGGVAGLAMAGPAGLLLGVNMGKAVSIGGIVLESSMTVGVLVAGAAAGSFTAKQIQQQAEQRIIAIGTSGTRRKLLLVRPKVWIDPSWEKICLDAKRNIPATQKPTFLGILSNNLSKEADEAKRKRYHRDSDIVLTAEFEIPTDEKVLLLASRILNDKVSIPGHVYRELIKEYRKRSSEQDSTTIPNIITEIDRCAEVGKLEVPIVRSRRLDAHAVIKHVTATLLEVRPGLASSPTVTDMAATAVEGLVFGELYHFIFGEIVEETKIVDKILMTKITNFDKNILDWSDISKKALNTLALISEAHTPVDKLRYSVHFLEHVSNHFTNTKRKAASADSLLKMVCLHLVVANVPYMNAEIMFLEEFARDERLLLGKEGYALVTLQASLHFLNASENFEKDIFLVDD